MEQSGTQERQNPGTTAVVEVRHPQTGQYKAISLSPLNVARLFATLRGFEEVDAEPTGDGDKWRITCRSQDGLTSFTVSGDTQKLACEKLVERLW